MLSSNSGKEIPTSCQGRPAQRARRLAIFEAWNKNPDFKLVGREFGLTRIRVRQIVWKAIVSDGCRSDQARAWMAQLDGDGYWLSRYELGFAKSRSDLEQLNISSDGSTNTGRRVSQSKSIM